MASTLWHFSHVHPLKLMSGTAESCGSCGLPIKSDNLFGCQPCDFFLHRFCALQYRPTLHQHPAHPQDLHLLYAPHYHHGRFWCNICGMDGEGWNYHCDPCNFDAHLLCTSMPRTVRRPGHQHPLQLWFRPPAEGSTNCHACRLQIHHCCYKCSSCDFVLHPGCLGKPLATDSNKLQVTTYSKRKHSKRKMVIVVGLKAMATDSNKLQVTTYSKRKHSKRKMAWGITKLIARKVGMHLLLDPFGGLGEPMDMLLFGRDDFQFLSEVFQFLSDGSNPNTNG